MTSLTKGSLNRLMNGEDVEKPILQVLGHKKLSSSANGERYRLMVSDGETVNSFTMLATQLNHMITEGQLSEFTICEISKYVMSLVSNNGNQRRVMVILDMKVVKPGHLVGHKIGDANSDANMQDGTTSNDHQKPPQAVKNTGSLVQPKSTFSDTSKNVMTTPISVLSPYQNKWIIKARVTTKSAIRTWSNSRGDGKLFSMDLVDESGEIRCTGFRDQVDKFYDTIEAGKLYYISRCALKPANKKFTTLDHEFEMTLTPESEVIPCDDDDTHIPTLRFNFEPISSIESKEKNDMLDILGVVKSSGDIQQLVARSTGRELKKRDVFIYDESGTMVCLTLWGTQAEEFDGSSHPILAIKGARIGEFGGNKNLSTVSSTVLQINPDIPEAHKLRGWANTEGAHQELRSISKASGGGGAPWMTFREVAQKRIGHNGTAAFYAVIAYVNLVRTTNAIYKSCVTESCKRKVVDMSNGMYRCEKCNLEFPNFKYRLLASMNLMDSTGSIWATAFNEEAEKIFGMSAAELGELKDTDIDAFSQKCSDLSFTRFEFKMRVHMDTYNDEQRIKTTVNSVGPVDVRDYHKRLLDRIKQRANISSA